MDEPKEHRRLVVELNELVGQQLDQLVELEELNKSTLVNRAVQTYHFIVQCQRAGRRVYVEEEGGRNLERLTIT